MHKSQWNNFCELFSGTSHQSINFYKYSSAFVDMGTPRYGISVRFAIELDTTSDDARGKYPILLQLRHDHAGTVILPIKELIFSDYTYTLLQYENYDSSVLCSPTRR